MTREGAIEIIQCGDISNHWGKDGEEVEKMAIKALEQEPILDKIIVEIEKEMKGLLEAEQQIYGKNNWHFVNKCIDIIDKYKAESEVQE